MLRALLPEAGTDIKGHMRSRKELLEASGYGNRPKDFDELLRILDGEIRLITPTDPEGKDADLASFSPLPGTPGRGAGGEGFGFGKSRPSPPTPLPGVPGRGESEYYQLTHDYLVPSLRDWLTRKQKETRHGRAELLLADRAAVWNARPENRQLPSLWQWLPHPLVDDEEELDAAAAENDAQSRPVPCDAWTAAFLFLVLLGWGGYEAHGRLKGPNLAGAAPRCEYGGNAGHRRGHGKLSQLA